MLPLIVGCDDNKACDDIKPGHEIHEKKKANQFSPSNLTLQASETKCLEKETAPIFR